MSTERGNAARSRPQKYQNHHVYKKDRYGTTPLTKSMDAMKIEGLCDRCSGIIHWKLKFKKYKKLTAPSKCTMCNQRTIKEAYHTICRSCASRAGKCPKCCEIIGEPIATETPISETIQEKTKRPKKNNSQNSEDSASDDEDIPEEEKEKTAQEINSPTKKRNISKEHDDSSPDLSTDSDSD